MKALCEAMYWHFRYKNQSSKRAAEMYYVIEIFILEKLAALVDQ